MAISPQILGISNLILTTRLLSYPNKDKLTQDSYYCFQQKLSSNKGNYDVTLITNSSDHEHSDWNHVVALLEEGTEGAVGKMMEKAVKA